MGPMSATPRPDDSLPAGLYERLLDEELAALLQAHPELTATFEKLDDEAQPKAYSQWIEQLLREALPACSPPGRQRDLVNRLIEVLAATDGLDYTRKRRLLDDDKTVLREVRRPGPRPGTPLPETSLSVSSLLTGAGDDPQLEREIRTEMQTADRVDILVSFIKWSGLSLLLSAFEDLEARGIPVRIITTSYMGASDPEAVEWLAARRGFSLRVSYDTERTRLHAKAYHFHRQSGYSTAYIGSANMSRPAMTSGLEWTVKVTAPDMPHILARFAAEFETYWCREEFQPYDPAAPERFREAIRHSQEGAVPQGTRFFADLRPHAFQERILEQLAAEREGGHHRNLVVAATGTGKTMIAAFDYARFRRAHPHGSRLLFVVHRKEILAQALDCFRAVLRDANFGELLVDGKVPTAWNHVFASVQSLNLRRPWEDLGAGHFDYVVVDETHHGPAQSYRALFESVAPRLLLGLTATPERMDGSSILPDFGNRLAAEVRLPEALEEKLLCPFHYFGVTDPVATADERFWRNGKYDSRALEEVYTGDDLRARQRLDVIVGALERYHPRLDTIRAVGFCAGIRHAEYMAAKFRELGHAAAALHAEIPRDQRDGRIRAFREGRLPFLFTVDLFNEGVDIPEINLVLFLRPTESLTVFLQQLGRGLRNAPEKDCLTVLDFVGQSHRKYRIDRKFAALLRTQRRRIDREIENDFPHLPPGCHIELERVAREHVLGHIRNTLGRLNEFVPEAIRSFEAETGEALTFRRFVEATDLAPVTLLRNKTWSEWKDLAAGTRTVDDPDLKAARTALSRVALRTDPDFLEGSRRALAATVEEPPAAYGLSEREGVALHYLLWGKAGGAVGVGDFEESLHRFKRNTTARRDLQEIIEWRQSVHPYPTPRIALPIDCGLRLHAAYGYREVMAHFGKASLAKSGPTGVGVVPLRESRTYLHFITFRKEERDFAPTTRYKDYPITPDRLHWESQASTTQDSRTGQDYLHFEERGFTILFFARMEKKEDGATSPFLFLGPATRLLHYESNRPIQMVWELAHPMPAALFETARAV